MDLIECIFGISPDGGSGLLEWLLLLMPFAVIASAYMRQCRHAQHSN
jgi:hypothetical protein